MHRGSGIMGVLRQYVSMIAVFTVVMFLAGCSTVIYERKKDEKNPMDEGMQTSLKLQGPKAVVKTQF